MAGHRGARSGRAANPLQEGRIPRIVRAGAPCRLSLSFPDRASTAPTSCVSRPMRLRHWRHAKMRANSRGMRDSQRWTSAARSNGRISSDTTLFLGLDNGAPRFSAIVEPAAAAFSVLPLIAQLDAADAPLFAAALSLSRWHTRHRFCANCGHATDVVRGGWSRKCPRCSTEHFPRVDPVVIMLVEHDGRVLLGRQPQYPPGRYSALAGFVEVGESIEDAVDSRNQRGSRDRRPRRPLRRKPAVAFPLLADDRLPRRGAIAPISRSTLPNWRMRGGSRGTRSAMR